jgi:hypothetical protein
LQGADVTMVVSFLNRPLYRPFPELPVSSRVMKNWINPVTSMRSIASEHVALESPLRENDENKKLAHLSCGHLTF